MKRVFCFSIIAAAAVAGAQTNPAPPAASQEIGLHAGRFYFDGNTRLAVYYNHVVITNAQGRLSCERLTIHLPPEGSNSHPTNAVAETNLDIVFVNNKGETNHLVADKGIYSYSVVNFVTNEMFIFTGHATNYTAHGWFTGEPLIWNNTKNTFEAPSNVDMVFKRRSGDTNGSLFNMMK